MDESVPELPTPRTDAWYDSHRSTLDTRADAAYACELGDFARTLERELAALRSSQPGVPELLAELDSAQEGP